VTGLFDAATMIDLVAAFRQVLTEVLTQPDRRWEGGLKASTAGDAARRMQHKDKS
jgi:hypothetical protein